VIQGDEVDRRKLMNTCCPNTGQSAKSLIFAGSRWSTRSPWPTKTIRAGQIYRVTVEEELGRSGGFSKAISQDERSIGTMFYAGP
jgi:hypothetical protein